MRTSGTRSALILATMFVLSTTILAVSTNAEDTTGRVTGNEEIIVSITQDYYDRGSDITVTFTSINLDTNSEYSIEWELCYVYDGCNLYSIYAADNADDPAESEGEIDIGSGTATQITTMTFSDPGDLEYVTDPNDPNLGAYTGLENESYYIKAILNVQGVHLHNNVSEDFVLGGKVRAQNSGIYEIENHLKNMEIFPSGNFLLDYMNYNILDYEITCELYEDGISSPVDTMTIQKDGWDYYISFHPYGEDGNGIDGLLPTAISGTHHVECTLVRLADNYAMHTLVSNDFQIIDETVTGNEELIPVNFNSLYFDRTSTGSTTQIAFDVTVENTYVGTTYNIDWELCYVYDGCDLYSMYAADNADDPIESEGQETFTATSSSEMITITIEDPGDLEYVTDPNDPNLGAPTGLENESYYIKAILNVQGVHLHNNVSEDFVLGGMVRAQDSAIYEIDNHLKNMEIFPIGVFRLDYMNYNILDYEITCELYEDGVSSPVDTMTIQKDGWEYYISFQTQGEDGNGVNGLLPTAVSGTHHVECTLVRLADNYAMHTLISNDFQIIDETVTGNEELIPVSFNSLYFDRTSTGSTTQISFDVTVENTYVGTTYNLDWELCYVYDGCNLYSWYAADNADDPAESEGQETFTATSSSEMITITIEDPGDLEYVTDPNDPNLGSYTGLENESYYIKAILNVQGVHLHNNESEDFVLGGMVRAQDSAIYEIDNHLNNMEIFPIGVFRLDYMNYNILDYEITCELYEDGVSSPVDTMTIQKDGWEYYISFQTQGEDGNGVNGLLPTAVSGTHHVECTLVRLADNYAMHTLISNDFQIIDDTSNQDDATISVSVDMHPTESWGTVVIDSIDLDPGQEYTLDWMVEDYSSGSPVLMIENDHIWVEGSDGVDSYSLEFHDLADTTDACITVVFIAGNTELQTVSNVCWASASTSDFDGDNVFDKDDLCPNSPAGAVVQADGCSDSDGDGFDSSYEVDCGSDPNDQQSIPSDVDNDGTCDALDADADDDGYLNDDEIAAGTDPLDPNSKPANRLPTCAVYYTLEVDGIPTTFEGDAAIPALSGVSAQTAVSALTPTTITIPEGNYYITAHCIDLDGDDITVTVNDITVGPMPGEVSAGAMIEIGEDVDETVDVQITWTDGTDTLTALVTVELDGDSSGGGGILPGFGIGIALVALLSAGLLASRRDE